MDGPCTVQSRERPRMVGLEQEAAGPHLQEVVAVAAAAAVEGGTCH